MPISASPIIGTVRGTGAIGNRVAISYTVPIQSCQVPSDFTDAIAGNPHYSTGTIEGSLVVLMPLDYELMCGRFAEYFLFIIHVRLEDARRSPVICT